MEMHEALRDISEKLGRIDGNVQGVLREQARMLDITTKTTDRVTAIEARVARILGYAAGAGAVAAFVVAILKDVLL